MPDEEVWHVYTKKVLDHFLDPRNLGEIENPDGVGQMRDPSSGDAIRMMIRVEGDRIADARFLASGCPAAIAVGSAVTELARGRTLVGAGAINELDISESLGALPAQRLHCSGMAAGALKACIEDHVRHARARGAHKA